MEENWKQRKKNLFSRYNKNSFLKRVEEEKHNYKKEKVKE